MLQYACLQDVYVIILKYRLIHQPGGYSAFLQLSASFFFLCLIGDEIKIKMYIHSNYWSLGLLKIIISIGPEKETYQTTPYGRPELQING